MKFMIMSGLWSLLCLEYSTRVCSPCSSEIQWLGSSLSYLTAIEVEWVSVGIGCQLSTATSDGATLDCFPVGFSDSCWFKIIFNVTWKLVTEDGAIIPWGKGSQELAPAGINIVLQEHNNIQFQIWAARTARTVKYQAASDSRLSCV